MHAPRCRFVSRCSEVFCIVRRIIVIAAVQYRNGSAWSERAVHVHAKRISLLLSMFLICDRKVHYGIPFPPQTKVLSRSHLR